MNDIKQFFQTKTGLVASAVLILVLGVYIGFGSSKSGPPPPTVEAPVLVASSTTMTPATQPVTAKSVSTKKTTTSAKTVTASAPVQTQTVSPVVTPQAPAPAPVVTSWHTAYTSNGNADTKTPPFTLTGAEQRITYSCSVVNSGDPYGSTFNGVIMSTTDQSVNDVFAWSVKCPTTNTVYEYSLSPGQYYLNLGPINSSYSVTVEDKY